MTLAPSPAPRPVAWPTASPSWWPLRRVRSWQSRWRRSSCVSRATSWASGRTTSAPRVSGWTGLWMPPVWPPAIGHRRRRPAILSSVPVSNWMTRISVSSSWTPRLGGGRCSNASGASSWPDRRSWTVSRRASGVAPFRVAKVSDRR